VLLLLVLLVLLPVGAAGAGFAGAFAAGFFFCAASEPTSARAAKILISFFMLSPENFVFSPAVALSL
jgi:hypothetical protein